MRLINTTPYSQLESHNLSGRNKFMGLIQKQTSTMNLNLMFDFVVFGFLIIKR